MEKNNGTSSHRPRTFSTEKAHQIFLFLLATFLPASFAAAQPAPVDSRKYLVCLKDKANTPYSLNNPSQFLSHRSVQRRLKQGISLTERDLPVNSAYADAIRQAGATVRYTSRWLNAALVEATPATLETILRLPFVKGLERKEALAAVQLPAGGQISGGQSVAGPTKHGQLISQSEPPLRYGPSIDQAAMIGADQMHQQGYRGEGMLVAVLDAGFRNVDQDSHFRHLFTNNQLVSTFDFVRCEPGVYEDSDHGAQVLGTMAGFEESKLVGTAHQARYILLRTEDASSESRVEEVNWLMAAEYADSAGVDVINSSLGYNTFDDPSQNYVYADLNGDKALITRAADWAAAVGILVVNSAGNEGANRWQYITAPADGDSVLAVASVNRNQVRAPSSSKGPSADGRVKPELAALGSGAVVGVSAAGNVVTSGGTSFSAPVLAGMATGFWQAHPQLTNMQVIDFLIRSASQYARPDSLLGYGIPHFVRASLLVGQEEKREENFFVYPNPLAEGVDPQVWLGNLPRTQRYTATLSDASGNQLWSAALRDELTPVPFRALASAPGIYFIRLTSEGGASFSAKLLKR